MNYFKKTVTGWQFLRTVLTSTLLILLLVATSLLGGCGIVESLPDETETQGLVISELESTDSEETLRETDPSETSLQAEETEPEVQETEAGKGTLDKNGSYTSKEEVALYLHTYGQLPSNFITKKEAEELGWNSSKGNLWQVADGMSIGGSYFGNYEDKLPKAKGRKYYECDIDYAGGYRGAKRIIYSNDGLIFYTEDHYESFEQLY